MTRHEGKQVTGLVQCCGVERFHEGKPSVTVQRQTSSERYVFLSQGQGETPGPACGNALGTHGGNEQ